MDLANLKVHDFGELSCRFSGDPITLSIRLVLSKTVWHINYQDVITGKLFTELFYVERVVSLLVLVEEPRLVHYGNRLLILSQLTAR